jgi:hypothetical protein
MAVLVLGLALIAASATADSFTPVRLAITVASSAHVATSLPISVTVSADAGVLDGSEGLLRIEVKLAGECGGDFATTPGPTLLNARLSPQPTTGKAYTATATGAGRPTATGTQTVCAFLEDSDIGRVYANDESDSVDVGPAVPSASGGSKTGGGGSNTGSGGSTSGSGGSTSGSGGSTSGTGGSKSSTGGRTMSRRCTVAVRTYDSAAKALHRAQRRLRHAKQRATRRRLQRTIAADKRTEARDRTHARAACGKRAKL